MNPRIAEFVAAAGDYVHRATGLELDGSVESLAYVDHYMAQAADMSDPLLELLAPAFGAYFGEIVLSRFGGGWQADSSSPQEWRIAIGPGESELLTFSPVAMAATALRRGEVEGYDAYLTTEARLEPALEEALERLQPVDERYYYSLTGRLELIEHVVDLLVGLQQRQ